MVAYGVTVPASADPSVLAQEGMRRHHVPILHTERNGQHDLEIRYPICLGALTVQTFKVAIARILDVTNWMLPRVRLSPPSLSTSAGNINVEKEALEIAALLKKDGLTVSQRDWGGQGTCVVYTLPNRPETELGFQCLKNRPDLVSMAGTPVPSATRTQSIGAVERIAFINSVAFEFQADDKLMFYLPVPPPLTDDTVRKIVSVRPLMAAMNVREHLGLAPPQ